MAPQASDVLFGRNSFNVDPSSGVVYLATNDPADAAEALYGNRELAGLVLALDSGGFAFLPELLAPAAAARLQAAQTSWIQNEVARAAAIKDNKPAFARTVAATLNRLAGQPMGVEMARTYLAGLSGKIAPESGLSPRDAVLQFMEPEMRAVLFNGDYRYAQKAELLAAYANVFGAVEPQTIENAAQYALDRMGDVRSEVGPELPKLFTSLRGPVLGAVLFQVGQHYRDLPLGLDPDGPARHFIEARYREPTPEHLIFKLYESMNRASQAEFLTHAQQQGIFSARDAEAFRAGRGLYERTFPFNYVAAAAEDRAAYYADRANEGSNLAVVMGVFWAAFDKNAGPATVTTLATAGIGSGIGAGLATLSQLGVRGAATALSLYGTAGAVAGTASGAYIATVALQEAITGHNAYTGAALRPEDRFWGRIALVLSGAAMVAGGMHFAVKAIASGQAKLDPVSAKFDPDAPPDYFVEIPELARNGVRFFAEKSSPLHQVYVQWRAQAGGARSSAADGSRSPANPTASGVRPDGAPSVRQLDPGGSGRKMMGSRPPGAVGRGGTDVAVVAPDIPGAADLLSRTPALRPVVERLAVLVDTDYAVSLQDGFAYVDGKPALPLSSVRRASTNELFAIASAVRSSPLQPPIPTRSGPASPVDRWLRAGIPGHLRSEGVLTNKDVAHILNAQRRQISAAQVDRIIGMFPADQQPLARQVLARGSGFAALEGFNALYSEVVGSGRTLFTPGRGSVADNLAYMASSKKQLFGNSEPLRTGPNVQRNMVVVLDDVVLQRIATDPDFVRNLVRKQATLIHPRGLTNLNPFQVSPPSAARQQLDAVMRGADGVTGSPERAAVDLLDAHVRATLEAADPRLLPRLRVADPTTGTPATSAGIAERLNGLAGIAAEDVAAAINQLPPRYQPLARELLIQQSEFVTNGELGEMMIENHRQLTALADGRPMYFYVPKPEKSYGMMAMTHRTLTNTPAERYIDGPDGLAAADLPDNAVVVILDDVAASGGSLVKAIAAMNYDGDVILAPLLAADKAIERFEKRDGIGDNVRFAPLKRAGSLKSSAFYQGLSHTDRFLLEKMMDFGWDGDSGLSVTFNYMAPNNNNNFFGQLIAPHFIVNKVARASKVETPWVAPRK